MLQMLETVGPPSLKQIAIAGLDWRPETLPADPNRLKAAVVAEAIRVAVSSLYYASDPPAPVHQTALRSWIRHKLEPLIPDLFGTSDVNFRQVLVEGRGANLEFLGDVVQLSSGYYSPAPSRVVRSVGESFLLVSGVPTMYFPTLRDRIEYNGLGRTITAASQDQLKTAGLHLQSLEDYVGRPSDLPNPTDLVLRILNSPPAPPTTDASWESYLGNLEPAQDRPSGRYGFLWSKPDSSRLWRSYTYEFKGTKISLWRTPVFERFFNHYLRVESQGSTEFHPIVAVGWKQACLALDALGGRPRRAYLVPDPRTSRLTLSLGFPPFEALAKVLYAFGGQLTGRPHGVDCWEIPPLAAGSLQLVLERVGVAVKKMG